MLENLASQLDHAFGRYRPIIDNWMAFQEALLRPLPTCIWANTLRVKPERLAKLLANDGISLRPLRWHPTAFRLSDDISPGRRWEYLAGLFHVQEEVSMLPVVLLDPQPGERILDLCAAPGNKTAQCAVAMANSGTILANDRAFRRLRAARNAIERLGLANVSTLVYDGTSLPSSVGRFDRVLVDVPCSAEGTSRKRPQILNQTSLDHSLRWQGIQLALLRRAVQLCRPGGRIIYATCTYAPEENEAVVDQVLRELGPDILRVTPASIPGLECSPGLTHWKDQQFDPSLHMAKRIWPHQNDSGGFFVVVLQKSGQPGSAEDMTVALPGRPEEATRWLAGLKQRFGIAPASFTNYRFFRRSRQGLHLVAQDHRPPAQPAPDASGFLFIRTSMRYPKLTTAAALAFGRAATRNTVVMGRQQAEAYLSRREVSVTRVQATSCTDTGYVLVRHEGFVLGVGLLWADEEGGGRVRSLYPRAWAPKLASGPFQPD
jgi:NOL1/NOP2/sun family putative RNA methylase